MASKPGPKLDEAKDDESLALLREIFPEASSPQLRELHQRRLATTTKRNNNADADTLSDVFRSLSSLNMKDDLEELERNALEAYSGEKNRDSRCKIFTRVLRRHPKVGLGMTLYEEFGQIKVHSLTSPDGRQWLSPTRTKNPLGPAMEAGIEANDILFGINGIAVAGPEAVILKQTVDIIRTAGDTIILHFMRPIALPDSPPPVISLRRDVTPSLLDETDLDQTIQESKSVELSFHSQHSGHSTPDLGGRGSPIIHPFVATLGKRGLLSTTEEKLITSRKLAQFDLRARQWEATNSFTIISEHGETFLPLYGVRKALSVRIVNTFLDGAETAYTIWVYDVETGKEWYAPLRYYKDFKELRQAIMPLSNTVSKIPFPKLSKTLFGSPLRPDTTREREERARKLESFLRLVCSLIYRDKLQGGTAELAVHVQSFLGCDSTTEVDSEPQKHVRQIKGLTGQQIKMRSMLKRSIQRYTYRLFLLDVMWGVVDTFVDNMRSSEPTIDDIESMEAQGASQIKKSALRNLEQMQTFLDFLQDLIIEGCSEEFRYIRKREDYVVLHDLFDDASGATFWDRLVREAVREQVEVEVYVPLRGVISKLLVHGCRHEDMEASFKMKELRKRPQSFFRIPTEKQDQSDWLSASRILKRGVSESTLPCAKLRAIVDTAQEVSFLFRDDRSKAKQKDTVDERLSLGADDFLPIFIYCVAQADLDRPCALSLLLTTLCDRTNRIGEVGYYVASFEAAIAHIQEMDLSQEPEEMRSFLSIPLDSS